MSFFGKTPREQRDDDRWRREVERERELRRELERQAQKQPRSCFKCEFNESGECRRAPPQIVDGRGSMLMHLTTWPSVKPHHWCGEFKEKAEATP